MTITLFPAHYVRKLEKRLLRVSSLSPAGLLSHAGYNLTLTTHGALLLPFIGTVQVLVAAHLMDRVGVPPWLSLLLRLTPWLMAIETVALAALMPTTSLQSLTASVGHVFNIGIATILGLRILRSKRESSVRYGHSRECCLGSRIHRRTRRHHLRSTPTRGQGSR